MDVDAEISATKSKMTFTAVGLYARSRPTLARAASAPVLARWGGILALVSAFGFVVLQEEGGEDGNTSTGDRHHIHRGPEGIFLTQARECYLLFALTFARVFTPIFCFLSLVGSLL